MSRDALDQDRYVLHGIPVDGGGEIRVSLVDVAGRVHVDLRLFLGHRSRGAEPTPEGVMVPLDRLADLELAVAKLRQASEDPRFMPRPERSLIAG